MKNYISRAAFKMIMFLSIVSLFSTTQNVFANTSDQHRSGFGSITIFWVNFAIFSAIMFFVIKKYIVPRWDDRREAIAKALLKGSSDLNEAQQLLKSAKESKAALESAKKNLHQKIVDAANLEAASIVSAAADKAGKIKLRNEDLVRFEEKAALSAEKQFFVSQVKAQAQAMIAESFTKEKDKVLRSSALNGIGTFIH
jgi:F0F1-type ATP synthase membrane subunit b/b'